MASTTARTFQALIQTPHPIFAIDVSAQIVSAMTLDTTWLDSTGDEHFRGLRERFPATQSGYATTIREALREVRHEHEIVALFALRDEQVRSASEYR